MLKYGEKQNTLGLKWAVHFTSAADDFVSVARIDSRGRILIPILLREKLCLNLGSLVELRFDGNRIIVKKNRHMQIRPSSKNGFEIAQKMIQKGKTPTVSFSTIFPCKTVFCTGADGK